jgi:hypothetical protein
MRWENKRNAVDRNLAAAIGCALNRLEDDPDLWVGILTRSNLARPADTPGRL